MTNFTVYDRAFTPSEIASIRQPADKIQVCGIYFLYRRGICIYIGQSVNIHSRLTEHKKRKPFDSVSILECSKEDLNDYETAYILKMKPKYNKAGASHRIGYCIPTFNPCGKVMEYLGVKI
jgi:hypothetical protein